MATPAGLALAVADQAKTAASKPIWGTKRTFLWDPKKEVWVPLTKEVDHNITPASIGAAVGAVGVGAGVLWLMGFRFGRAPPEVLESAEKKVAALQEHLDALRGRA